MCTVVFPPDWERRAFVVRADVVSREISEANIPLRVRWDVRIVAHLPIGLGAQDGRIPVQNRGHEDLLSPVHGCDAMSNLRWLHQGTSSNDLAADTQSNGGNDALSLL